MKFLRARKASPKNQNNEVPQSQNGKLKEPAWKGTEQQKNQKQNSKQQLPKQSQKTPARLLELYLTGTNLRKQEKREADHGGLDPTKQPKKESWRKKKSIPSSALLLFCVFGLAPFLYTVLPRSM